ALCISIVVPLLSVRTDVDQETESSTQLARMVHDIESAVHSAEENADALAAVANRVRASAPLRHVKIEILDSDGRVVAASSTDDLQGGRLARALLPAASTETARYPIGFHGGPLVQVRVLSNPLSEITEIEQRVFRDLALLALTILAMA